MSEIIVLGTMDNTVDHTFESANRVYSTNGLAPTVNTCGGGGLQAKVIEVRKMKGGMKMQNTIYDDFNSTVRSDQSTMPTLRTNCGNKALGNGVKVIESVSVKQATKRGYVECEIGGIADLSYPTSKTRRGRVIDEGRICPTLTTGSIPCVIEKFIYEIDGELYLIRIRKLTPRECWRLMGFSDDDFDKASAVNSNTQLYKQAGNSIVKNVLEQLFKQFCRPQDRMTTLKMKSLSLLDAI